MSEQLLVDESLRGLATDEQWERYKAYCEAGSYRKAAALLGETDESKIRKSVKRLQEAALRAGKVPEGYVIGSFTTQTNADGDKRYAQKVVRDGGDRQDFPYVPDPKLVKFTTTNLNSDLRVKSQWVREQADAKQKEAMWLAFGKGLSSKIKRADPLPAPIGLAEADRLTVYGVGDHHLGMLAHGDETGGDNYNIPIAEHLLDQATTYLASIAPQTWQAVVAFMGDFTHTDSYAPLTPASGHLLDADNRFPNIAEAAARAMRRTIDRALLKHQSVHVVVTAGNHDPVSTIWLRIALAAVYEKEPRVTIDMKPRKFHYFEWGKCLFGFTHGDRLKLENLPAIMATDMPEAWGRTICRMWFTGHVHHDKMKDLTGAKVISLRVLPPGDAYTANSGYRTPRDMKAFLFHRKFGEAGSLVAPAGMFQQDLAA